MNLMSTLKTLQNSTTQVQEYMEKMMNQQNVIYEKRSQLAIQMRDKSTLIEDDPSLSVYQLPIEDEIRDTEKILAKCYVGEPIFQSVTEKVLMVVGATGAGKTTLINGMVNYILGVEWKDDFRFKLVSKEENPEQKQEGRRVSQAHSQTKYITAYTIHHMDGSRLPYTLTIIDTPGFGDTEGLERDKFITNQIREFFSEKRGIDHLDGIGFVIPASDARLTPTQLYIFDSILAIFGKDVAENIFIMVTFADGQRPPVMDAIKEAKVPYAKHLKFNNSALFAKNTDDEESEDDEDDDDDDEDNFDAMFWRMGYKSFKKFFQRFQKAESVSLLLTRDVLNQRRNLENLIQSLLEQINLTMSEISQLQQLLTVLDQHKAEMEANQNFTYTTTQNKNRKIPLKPGVHVTNCLHCHTTCHYHCAFANNDDKKHCAAMNSDGYCKVCSQNCHWTTHVNNGYKIEWYEEKVSGTYDKLKKRYDKALSGKSTAEAVISEITKNLKQEFDNLFRIIRETKICLQRLKEIALKPDPLTEVQYIDILIDSEKKQANEGWEQRVKYLEVAKEQAELISKMSDTDNPLGEIGFEQFRDILDKVGIKIPQISKNRRVDSRQKRRNRRSGFFRKLFGE